MPRSKTGLALRILRGPVHGNFAEGAAVTQNVMGIFSQASQWPKLSPARKEAIHMIVHKLHRIVTGNYAHKDHWDDIGGYAGLGANDGEPTKVSLRAARPARKPRPPRVRKVAKKVAARPARPAAKKRAAKKVAVKRARSAKKRVAQQRPARQRQPVVTPQAQAAA